MNGAMLILQGFKKPGVIVDEIQADSLVLEALFGVAADYNDEAQADSLVLEALFGVANDTNVGITAVASSKSQARSTGPTAFLPNAPTLAAPYSGLWYVKSIGAPSGVPVTLSINAVPQYINITTGATPGSASALVTFGVLSPLGVESTSAATLSITVT